MESHDSWWPVEGAEHQDDPPVFPDVCDGLYPAARLIEIGDRALVDDCELVAIAFW